MDTEKEAEKGLLMSENIYSTVLYTCKIYKMYKCGFACDASLSKIQNHDVLLPQTVQYIDSIGYVYGHLLTF